MHIASQILYAITIALGFLLFAMLNIALGFLLFAMLGRKWLVWLVPTASFAFAALWYLYVWHSSYLHVWHSAWLGSVPAVIVDGSTFGLAALGGYVALNAPRAEQRALKGFYVISFIALAILGIGANIWQRNVEAGKQASLQQNETDARKEFSENLKDVKKSSDAILSFVTNPPKGISAEQGLAFAKALAARRGVFGKFDNISNARVGDMARAIARSLNETAQYWRADDRNAYLVALDSPCYGNGSSGPNGRENCAHAQAQWVTTEKQLNARWQEKAKDLVNQANECRVEIMTRLLLPRQKGDATDGAAKLVYEKMIADSKNISPENLIAAGSYLDNLWKRLP
jgi:hypothetical protein